MKYLSSNLLSFWEGKGVGDESEWFKIDSGMRQGCIISPWLFNLYMDAVMKEMKRGMERRGVRFLEEGREFRLPGLLYADDWFCVVSV